MKRKSKLLSYVLLISIYIHQSRSQNCGSPCSQTQTCPDRLFGNCCHKENIARGKPTNQSNFYTDEISGRGRVNFTSHLAVDGNTNTNFSAESCTHTDPGGHPDATWTVNLGSTFNISQIKIYLRNIIGNRNNGLRVRVDQKECLRLSKTFIHDIQAEDTVQDIRCNRPLQGTTVTVQVNGPILTLCEVQVFVCSDGWYGEDCDRQCQCKDSEVCDKITGWCRTGCRAGKQGDGCQCDCPDGSYGLECSNVCGSCTRGSACDKINGTCHQGCTTGFKPPLCQVCSDGWYGEDCQICDKVTGLCRTENETMEPETGCQCVLFAVVGVICGLIFGIVSTLTSQALIKKLRNKCHGDPKSETVQQSNLYNTLSLDTKNENTYSGLNNITGVDGRKDSEDTDKQNTYYNTGCNTLNDK